MNYQNTVFVRSAATEKDLLRDALPQIAFSGRSNAGKSSVVNRLLQRKNLARVGAQPGKTIHVNYFCVDSKLYFADLPGYGYAKISKAEKDRWSALLEAYFSSSAHISLGILILDVRRTPNADDLLMADWFRQTGCPFCAVANKLDKLKKSEIAPQLAVIEKELQLEPGQLIPFSAEKGTGREELLARIEESLT